MVRKPYHFGITRWYGGKAIMSLTIEKLEPFGAVITTDIEELLGSPTAGAEVMAALGENKVLIFKGLELDDATQLEFTSTLGEVIVRKSQGWSDEFPGIYRVALDPAANSEMYVKGAWDWHIDGATTNGFPPRATMLSCHQPPTGEGGETEFVNTYAAYDMLTDDEKEFFSSVEVLHKVRPETYTHKPKVSDADRERLEREPEMKHPVVWTHTDGRKSLVLGITVSHIEGMPYDEGRKIMFDLLDRVTQPEHILQHTWSLNDVVVWDNTGTMHRGRPFTEESGRDMHRTTIVGEELIR
jgi:alpha-ketoglutarate-dependent taurine dioxygenase